MTDANESLINTLMIPGYFDKILTKKRNEMKKIVD